ncbi:L-threonine 3-dehydrogenase [Actinopolymorpha pittospori]|uniref:L-threonine 3-dehydrogenase n=1 Tax=Actinopolymorpha pittospori TaxID=648752 RepID=A0A927MSA2_9ACTN|nr:L-threonine 3-dehydrogenase [Actinopolymorpha pittospori]MBE1605362.1 threonine 3-dehydrogenase [Actinopolymorpha pittospori]
MRALVKAKAEPGLWLEEVPDPAPGPGEALVQVLQTGICGTDLHILAWDDWARTHVTTPLVVGHEFVGRVVELGPGADSVAVGDIVSGEGHLVCGRCRNCMAGRRHLCANTQGVGLTRAGAFADYLTLPVGNLWKHPADIDLDVATIFDPFGNAVHTALAYPVVGEDVLITGAGPIGLMAAAVVRHAGARHVVITDVNDYRLELANKVGVTAAVNVGRTSLAEVKADLGMKEGFDIGLEMSGHPTALPAMVDSMAHGGRIAVLGLSSGPISIDWSRVVLSMLTIRGIYGRQMFETWYAMSVLVEEGLDISPVITHRFPMTEHDQAFATMREGNCGKVILDWTRG